MKGIEVWKSLASGQLMDLAKSVLEVRAVDLLSAEAKEDNGPLDSPEGSGEALEIGDDTVSTASLEMPQTAGVDRAVKTRKGRFRLEIITLHVNHDEDGIGQ